MNMKKDIQMSRNRLGKALRYTVQSVVVGITFAAGSAFAGEAVDSARAYMQSGDQKAAVIELKNALQNDPGDVAARLLLGELYLQTKKGAAAEKEFRRAADLDADPSAWSLNLVQAMLLQGKFSDALDLLDEAKVVGAPEESRAMALRGQASMGLKRFEDAKLYYDHAVRIDPNNAEAALGKISLMLTDKENEQAKVATDQFLEKFPEHLDALLIRAELHRQDGELAEAAERFAQVSELNPQSLRALLGHATTMIALDNSAQATADLDRVDEIQKDVVMTHYLRGVIAFRDKDWDTASDHLQKVLMASPGNLQSQLLLGIISFSKQELQIAEEYLGSVVGAMPNNAQAVKILAATRIKLREPEKAIEVLRPFVQNHPDAQSMALLGSAYVLKGDQEKGQEWLNRAVEESPDVAALRTQLALTLLAGGETEKAITELQSAVDLGQDILQADVLLVLAHLKNKELDKALQASTALEQRMPDSPIASNLTGLALLAQGERQKARESFLKALELNPDFATAALNIARIEVAEENYDAAQKQYESVLSRKPQHLGALLGRAALAERRGDTVGMVSWLEKAQSENPTEIQPGLLLTKHYLSQKDALKAVSVAANLNAEFPQNPRVLAILAQAQTLAGESANAIRTFEQLARIRPEDAQLQYLLGGAKWKAEDLYGAREAFRRAVHIKTDYLNAWVALASVELQDGRVGDALEIARQIQQDYPDIAAGYQIEGNVYLSQSRPADALKALETAYTKQKSSQLVQQLAKAYSAADRREDAINALEGWMAEQPEDLGALAILAMSYQAAGRDDEAVKAYEKFGQSGTKNAYILNNLAWLYQKSGDSRALETAKQAYELDTDRPEIADTYGWILLQSGEVQEGLSILQQAYVAFPTQTEIGYHVAVGLSQAERNEEAVKVLRRLLRENPDFPQAQDAKVLLEKLEQ